MSANGCILRFIIFKKKVSVKPMPYISAIRRGKGNMPKNSV